MTPEEKMHELGLIQEGGLFTQREKFLLDTIADLEAKLAAKLREAAKLAEVDCMVLPSSPMGISIGNYIH